MKTPRFASNTMENYKKVNDDDSPGPLRMFTKDYEFFHNGLKLLLHQMSKYDPIVKDFDLSQSPFEYEKGYLDRMIKWGESLLSSLDNDSPMITIDGISYRSLRFLKAGGLLQVIQLEQKKRDLIERSSDIPLKVLQSIDDKIGQMRNWTEQGIFNGLKPADFYIDNNKFNSAHGYRIEKDRKSNAAITIKVQSEGLQPIDKELRSRCLDLLNNLPIERKEENRLDTVVREMSVILENRIKRTAGITEKITGKPLMARAFVGKPPLLKFSDDDDVQQSAYFLYAGFSGFVRNEVMHQVVHTFTKERVFQLLGYVDYLLFLLTQAKKSSPN